jgi:hypothetical protein
VPVVDPPRVAELEDPPPLLPRSELSPAVVEARELLAPPWSVLLRPVDDVAASPAPDGAADPQPEEATSTTRVKHRAAGEASEASVETARVDIEPAHLRTFSREWRHETIPRESCRDPN